MVTFSMPPTLVNFTTILLIHTEEEKLKIEAAPIIQPSENISDTCMQYNKAAHSSTKKITIGVVTGICYNGSCLTCSKKVQLMA